MILAAAEVFAAGSAAAASAAASATIISASAYAAAVFAINFAVSMVVTRIFGQEPPDQTDNGVRLQVPPSTVNAIPVVYGNAYLGGTFVDAALTTDQQDMYYVIAVSCISPNGQFTFDRTQMYFGDRLIGFDTTNQTKVISLTDQAGNLTSDIQDNLYIYLYTSNAAGVITPVNSALSPSTVMGATSGLPAGLQWAASNRQMNGLAFAIVKMHYSANAQTTALSPITFYVSHYLNGTGATKPGDVWYDYMNSSVYGGDIDAAYLDSASVTALNAYSDELIPYTTSGGAAATMPRYRINGVLNAGETVLNNIDKIMMACDSWMAYQSASGKWSLVVNKPETAAYSFNDSNIIGEIRVGAIDLTNSINQIEAKFPSNVNRDKPDFIFLETPSGLLFPNEPTNKQSVTFDLVNNNVQAGYLANRMLEQAREDLTVTFNTTYYGIQVDAGNVISVTNADYGWSSKLFRVMKVNESSLPDGSLGATLELNEYNAAVYDDLTIQAFAASPNSNLPYQTVESIATQAGTALISGTTMTGSGVVINPSGTFAIGSSVGNITYNGSGVYLNQAVNANRLTIADAYGTTRGEVQIMGTDNLMQINKTNSTLLPAVYIFDNSTGGTSSPSFHINNVNLAPSTGIAYLKSQASGAITLYVESTGSGSGAAKFYNTNATKNVWLAPGAYSVYSAAGGGQSYIGDGYLPFTGQHQALISNTAVFDIGDIVYDVAVVYKQDINNVMFEVAVSDSANQPGIGIISNSRPVDEFSILPSTMWEGLAGSKEFVTINAVGEGQINVCGEGGDIQPGDLIVTSSIAGKGMKQSDNIVRNVTIAKARESASFGSATEQQQIACIYLCG